MASYKSPNLWVPSVGIELEATALETVRSASNYLVVAGPGAGKTELLAQRASFLLETNTCQAPQRILAISFKRDAADNLKARVESRIGVELADRFDSHTFDSFAKSLVERFREGITEGIRPPSDFEIVVDFKSFADSVVGPALKAAIESNPNLQGLRNLSAGSFLNRTLCRLPLEAFAGGLDAEGQASKAVWLTLMKARPCCLTFDMVKRLAERIVSKNPRVTQAMRITYKYVFLDEYQDTTEIQYDLLRCCFPQDVAVLTAVGDNKQRIMLWANAMPNAFDRFKTDYKSEEVQLLLNRRSDSKLVHIQQSLIAAIDPHCKPSQAAPDKMDGDGVCAILQFDNEDEEANDLLKRVQNLLSIGIPPNELCVIVRKTALVYVHSILRTFNLNGVKCRLEEPFQLLLRDGLIVLILNLAHLALRIHTAKYWQETVELYSHLSGLDIHHEQDAYSAEQRLTAFLAEFKALLLEEVKDIEDVSHVIEFAVSFLDRKRIRAHFSQHQNEKSLEFALLSFAHLMFNCLKNEGNWKGAIASFYGSDSIPIMTIHKSKGLEYHSVFFVGLEDDAWWNFAKQGEEERCAFFVAFSRAKKQVFFTFCRNRAYRNGEARITQKRESIASLYALLQDAGAEVIG